MEKLCELRRVYKQWSFGRLSLFQWALWIMTLENQLWILPFICCMSQSNREVIRKSLAGYIVIFPFKYLFAISLPRHFFSFYSSYQSIFTYPTYIMNSDFLRINIVYFKYMSLGNLLESDILYRRYKSLH